MSVSISGKGRSEGELSQAGYVEGGKGSETNLGMVSSVEAAGGARVSARGRSLFADGTKLRVRGVTYGTFADGGYPLADVVESDFAAMVANGVNAVRTYTVPPGWLLDLAH